LQLSIIIPLYNEAGVIEETLGRLVTTVLPEFVSRAEIIVVDDCSTDNSARLAEILIAGHEHMKLIRLPVNGGKGVAVAAGVREARGDTILIQDADLELDPADIPGLLEKYHGDELDLLSGSRFISGKCHYGHAAPAVMVNRLFSSIVSKLTLTSVTDMTCGYKIFNRSLFMKLSLNERGFGFETELVIKALRIQGLKYGEKEVRYTPRRKNQGKKIGLFDGFGIGGKMFMYGLEGRRWLSALAIFLMLIFMTGNMLSVKHWKDEKRVIEWDAISYYAYLPAAFIYHDLTLSFADGYKGPHRFIVWPEKGPEGRYVIKTSMGLSILWTPFFFAGHAAALLSGADAGGYSSPYKFFLLVSSLFFLCTGLIYLRKILLAHATDRITALVLAGFVLGTNLYWYTLFQGTMSHVYSFALISAFVWNSMRWHGAADNRTGQNPVYRQMSQGQNRNGMRVWSAVRLGLLLGLISLIRPTNIIVILFFLLYGVGSNESLKLRVRTLASEYPYLLLAGLMTLVVWLPQMVYWKEMTGHWLYFSYGSDERFFFGNPAILKGLFSWRKGLFIYTPVMIFAVAGITALWVRRSPHALPVTLFVPLNIYIIFSWWCWWYGGGFGQRAFIDSYSLMAVSSASLLTAAAAVPGKSVKTIIPVCFLLLMSLGIFNNIQYYHGAIHWDSMTRKAYFDSFGRVRPSAQFDKLLEAPDYDKAREGSDR
jgi:glycosyltransferase involved in cell wall biosynthesis